MAEASVISISNTNPTLSDPTKSIRKRKLKRVSKEQRMEKRMKSMPRYQGSSKKPMDDKKAKRLIRKRTREYNSDEDEEEEEEDVKTKGEPDEKHGGFVEEEEYETNDDSNDEDDEFGDESEDEDGMKIPKEVTKFVEGCRGFKMAFQKIMKKTQPSDALGPVLSAHKKFLVEKLAGEAEELKGKREVKKERHLVGEKGHVLPANFHNSKDKFLSSVATKGVVKLFNAVNKAQHAQKGLNPNKEKDAKTLAKRKKDAFLSELRKPTTHTNGGFFKSSKEIQKDEENEDEPGWAPLKDSYMLTNPKMKDWDKMVDSSSAHESYKTTLESSDDEE